MGNLRKNMKLLYDFQNFFSDLPDFRIERGKLHLLSDILMLSLINRVFRHMDSVKFEQILRKFSAELLDFMNEYHVAIDGKVLRAMNPSGKKKRGKCV